MAQNSGTTYLPAIKGRIGKWIFYTTIMTLKEIDHHVSLSTDIYENKGLSDMMQRSVKSERADAIANYLTEEAERFFPSMIVAVYDGRPKWVEMSIDEESDRNYKIDFSHLSKSKKETLGFLILTGEENLFPLDGQHRLQGIRQALSGTNSNNSDLSDDEMAVTFVAHERSEEGRVRSRRLFTTLNKRAVPVAKQEIIALDEDEVTAISTRYLVEKYEPLSREGNVLFQSYANIPKNNTHSFTSVFTVYDTLCDLFPVLSGIGIARLKNRRMDRNEIGMYCNCAKLYYDQLMKIFPEVGECLTSKNPSKVVELNRHKDGGHILFRPVGQKIFSKLISTVMKSKFPRGKNSSGSVLFCDPDIAVLAISEVMSIFSDIPTEISKKPYRDIIFGSKSKRVMVSSASIVRDIILEHFGYIDEKKCDVLDKKIRKVTEEKFGLKDYRF